MFSSLEKSSLEHIEVIQLLLNVHKGALSEKDAALRQKIKIFSVSSCVTRLYAVYENFIETGISDYLDSLPELVKFETFPDEFKNEYRIGISHILNKIDHGRYNHLNHENIVTWYYQAITDQPQYRFVTEAFKRHEQNLRLNIVEMLFNRIHLKDFKNWLSKHPDISNLYSEKETIYEQLEAEIKNFVQLRNDASHGIMDTLEGDDNLNRLCDLIKTVIMVISSFLNKSLLEAMQKAGQIRRLGIVTESFGQNGAFIAKLENGAKIRVKDRIHFVYSNNCYSQVVDSIMVNDISVENVMSDSVDFEVGLKCSLKVKKKAEIFLIK